MDPILIAKLQLEKRLRDSFPTLQIALEGVAFTAPEAMHLYCNFNIFDPDDSTLGSRYYRENLEFVVYVSAPKNQGTGPALTQAGLIRQAFPRGLALDVDNTRVHLFCTPKISGTITAGSRVVIPVTIPVTVEVLD
jgi:hypothetical protein